MREAYPSLCELVDIRCLQDWMTIAGQIIEAQLIAHDEKNVAGVRIFFHRKYDPCVIYAKLPCIPK